MPAGGTRPLTSLRVWYAKPHDSGNGRACSPLTRTGKPTLWVQCGLADFKLRRDRWLHIGCCLVIWGLVLGVLPMPYLEFEKPLAEIEGKSEKQRAMARGNAGDRRGRQ